MDDQLEAGSAMLSGEPWVVPQAALEEAKAYLRVFGMEEDALVRRALEAAASLCEAFTGLTLIVRAHEEVIAVTGAWTQLSAAPVRSIGTLSAWEAGGTGGVLPAAAYAADIDADGRGWVRVNHEAARRVRVRFEAGLAADWAGVPMALRQGMLRLAGHLHAEREAGEAAPPASVAALWRPWRRMQAGGRHVRAG